ncbi:MULTISPECIES: hypothetical protein [unclassified Streptomyces]|uniref:hypothetical protein n=1 Tax=unclassified Streptomyces TaxID=2593676 RepID=UPI001BE4EE02|nr:MULTISPECIES: hypothetical protein [unclassified Streptomyces]MBT2407533.1 hypothetical protein [Streptomyces sp. ISL-21]MBT2608128.1 hypothetical protein [Streptomyces sp. ISL-87]
MMSDFIAMVAEQDPKLAEILAKRIADIRTADAALVKAGEFELAELHQKRPKSIFGLRNVHPISEFFAKPPSPDPELVERRARIGLSARSVIERMERRHHE